MFTKEKILYTDLRNIRTDSELYAFDNIFEHHSARVLSTTVCSSKQNNRDRAHNIVMSVLASLETFKMKSHTMYVEHLCQVTVRVFFTLHSFQIFLLD